MKILIIGVIFALSATMLFSQSDKKLIDIKGSQILYKGKVTDLLTGKPVGTVLEFKDKNGKKIKTQSNALTGEWEQLLESGDYEVLIFSWNVVRQASKLIVPQVEKFKEDKLDFVVRRMEKGDKVYLLQSFAEASSSADMKILSEIDQLKEVMRFNRGVDFVVYVNAEDLFKPIAPQTDEPIQSNPKDKKKKKSKTKEKEVPKPIVKEKAKADFSDLVNSRLEVVKNYISSWGAQSNRIKVLADIEGVYSDYPHNMIVVVEKNEDIFKNSK